MKAQSEVYIKLQNIYKAKARQDADEVYQTVRRLAPDRDIDPTEVELFCTNARFIKLINSAEGRTPSLAEVVGQPSPSPPFPYQAQHCLKIHLIYIFTAY